MKSVAIMALQPGMVLGEDVIHQNRVIFPANTTLDETIISKLKRYSVMCVTIMENVDFATTHHEKLRYNNKFLLFEHQYNIAMQSYKFFMQNFFSTGVKIDDAALLSIYSDLKDMGISKYKFKVSFLEKEKITSEILSKETNDIEWLEIEEVGSKYVVNVLQRKKNNDNDTCNYRHIVAKKDSMITSIFASSGEVVKKKYDYVKKGDILISGFIYNKELIKEKRCAEGVVLGEVWYKVLVFLPKQYYEEKVTGNKNIGVRVDFFNYSFSLFNKYDTYNIKSRNIVKNNLLPIGISLATYLETKSIVKEFDINNVDKEAFLIARDKLYSKLGKDISIKTQKVLKKEEKKSKILVEVFIKVEEDITDYFDITNINIDEINNSTKKE